MLENFALVRVLSDVWNGASAALLRIDEGTLGGIEGMRSQEWSSGIFVFLIISVLVFIGIVFQFMTNTKSEGLKKGEKVLFAWIILGVIGAVIFGAMQLLFGRLF